MNRAYGRNEGELIELQGYLGYIISCQTRHKTSFCFQKIQRTLRCTNRFFLNNFFYNIKLHRYLKDYFAVTLLMNNYSTTRASFNNKQT